MFSLGAVAFELLARRPLLPVGHRLAEYESRVHSLTLMDMTGKVWLCLGIECVLALSLVGPHADSCPLVITPPPPPPMLDPSLEPPPHRVSPTATSSLPKLR